MNLSENIAYIILTDPADINGSGIATDYFSMKNFGRVAIVLNVGAVASQGAALTVTLYEAKNIAGASAQALAIPRAYYFDATTDMKTDVTVAGNGTIAVVANRTYVIDVHETELTCKNDFDCLKITVADPGVSAIMGAVAVAYNAKMVKTALTN